MEKYVTPLEFEERIMLVLEQVVENTKRIAELERKIDELFSLIAGGQTETRNRANQIYFCLKNCGKLSRAEVNKLLNLSHPQAAMRAMQECVDLHSDTSIQRDGKGRLYIILNEF